MTVYKLDNVSPHIDESAYVAKSADVIGDVSISKGASIWFGASVRGDKASISIGENSNIQEGAVLHVDPGYPLKIGAGVTIGHLAMLHGCTIEDGTLIGIQAVVLNGAVIGRNCLVGAGAIVTENKVFPDNSLILGVPAKVVKELSEAQVASLSDNASTYVELAGRYKAGLQEVD
ncbi:gamma carbonic anhydrase family protein [Burkholderia stagnalis]|uniref:Gamma carbonic anhydrase family protein n=1 Tax=Burkholderia stagnalis TaxID=1503054 RepID=A0A6L3MP80_9BURK|nr:gamma carbonic anhydrase family protein [Burkholderia stagnalis]KAB0633797.1 gamma carbonic anhydrase family protein [Burkholderia stagnalis]